MSPPVLTVGQSHGKDREKKQCRFHVEKGIFGKHFWFSKPVSLTAIPVFSVQLGSFHPVSIKLFVVLISALDPTAQLIVISLFF